MDAEMCVRCERRRRRRGQTPPLSLLIHGLACLAILLGWPCSEYAKQTTMEKMKQLYEQRIPCQLQTWLL